MSLLLMVVHPVVGKKNCTSFDQNLGKQRHGESQNAISVEFFLIEIALF